MVLRSTKMEEFAFVCISYWLSISRRLEMPNENILPNIQLLAFAVLQPK